MSADLHEVLVELIDAHHHRPRLPNYRTFEQWLAADRSAGRRRADAWANAIEATGHDPQPPGQAALFEETAR